jgi:hypothetical protein
MDSHRRSFLGGVVALVLAVIILIVDDTKNAATYFAIGMLIVLGLWQVVDFAGRRTGSRA